MDMNPKPTFQWANENIPLSLTSKYIVPDSIRPDISHISSLKSIPIVDLSTNNNTQLVEDIKSACEEFGVFQVINHGIPKELCKDVVDVITRFFHLPNEEKSHLVSRKHMEDGTIFNYYVKNQENEEKIDMWAESFFHTWHPSNNFTHNLPENPPDYRKVIDEYAKKVGELASILLGLISEGLGLCKDYLEKTLGKNPTYTAQANYYPRCPKPELTLGLPAHTDINILTILLQEEGVKGLHVLKDGQWLLVHSLPGALVVNVADQLQILSNDRFKSVYHRAVTNEEKKRVSFAMFVGPNYENSVGPISELVNENQPALYRTYTFGEFVHEFRNQEGKPRKVKEVFKI